MSTSPRSWLLDVLWADAEQIAWFGDARSGRRTDRLVAAPDVAGAKQLVPWSPSSIAAATHRLSDDRPPSWRWRDAAGVAGLLSAGAVAGRRRIGVSSTRSLLDDVADALGHPRLRGIVMCGPPRANQKPVIQVHDRAGRTIAFVKVAWNDLTRGLLTAERGALEHLAAIEHPAFRIPPILAGGEFGSATWLAIGALGVERRTRPALTDVDALAAVVERTAEAVTVATIDASFTARLRTEAAGLPIAEPQVARLVERHAAAPLTLAGGHGDFVPWNILSGAPSPAVWDWERYDTAVPVGSDRIHYRAQLAIQRRGVGVVAAFAQLADELATILPDVPAEQRQAHLDWYLANLLVRYEHDALFQPTDRLRSRIADLTTVLDQRAAAR